MLTRVDQPLIDSGDEMGVRVVGIVAAVILAAGILPPYGELWKRQGRVIGINWVCRIRPVCDRRQSGTATLITHRSSLPWTRTGPSSR